MEFLRKSREFFREVMAEFRKVTWPGQPVIVNSTVVVLVVTGAVAFFLWVADMGLARLVRVILE
ncbi:MAG: preprotein translocase subunit SecE [Candidatus Rokuibacteriota bacterium]